MTFEELVLATHMSTVNSPSSVFMVTCFLFHFFDVLGDEDDVAECCDDAKLSPFCSSKAIIVSQDVNR